MAKKPKFTPAQIKKKVEEIQGVIEQQKRENQGEHFVSITREEIEKNSSVQIPHSSPSKDGATRTQARVSTTWSASLTRIR